MSLITDLPQREKKLIDFYSMLKLTRWASVIKFRLEKLYEELLYDATKTLPTHHAKILIAQDLSNYDYAVFNAFMETLHAHAVAFDFDQAVRLMKQMVPEFKSQNSVFEQFDV